MARTGSLDKELSLAPPNAVARCHASVELEAFTDARLAAIVRSSQDAIVGFGLDLRIQAWNTGAERMFGYTPQEAIGQLYTMPIAMQQHPRGWRGR